MRAAAAAVLVAMAGVVAGQPARAQTLFTGDHQQAALLCADDAAIVRGSGNRLSIGGACRSLTVTGSGNVIAVALVPGGAVRVSGNANRILYRSPAGPPHAQTSGADNQVVPDPRPPTLALVQAPPPLLTLNGASQVDQFCGGSDVLVLGDDLDFVLRGGCRSITVQGRRDRITAELLPGAQLAVGGPGVTVNYVLVAHGPPPVVRVTARGLRATQLQRFGEGSLRLPTGN